MTRYNRPSKFNRIYNRPQRLQRDPLGARELPAARQDRREMVNRLIQKAGGQKAFANKAYGKNYRQGELQGVMTNISALKSSPQVPGTTSTDTTLSDLQAKRDKLLAQRKAALKRVSQGPTNYGPSSREQRIRSQSRKVDYNR